MKLCSVFSKLTSSLRNRFNQECVLSTTQRRALGPGVRTFSSVSCLHDFRFCWYPCLRVVTKSSPRAGIHAERFCGPRAFLWFCVCSSVGRRRCAVAWPRAVSPHARWPRWRPETAGCHARRPAGCACARFFPRSVGLGTIHCCARGALPLLPSMLCQRQAMPSISSYSASPACQRRRKNPACCQR
jgi:hypothetical protein